MKTRFTLALLGLIVMIAALPAVALAAPATDMAADPLTPERCRELYGTDDWTRRCLHLDDEADLIRYCRRAYGTDAWTRRCRQLFDRFDPIAYCRRIHGTDLWTRRCLHLQPDPTPVVVRPGAVEPVRPVQVAPVDPAPTEPAPPESTAAAPVSSADRVDTSPARP